MANEQHGPLSIRSNNAAFASAQFLACVVGASGISLPGAGGQIIGVTQTKAAIGKAVKVEQRPGFRTRAIAGGTVAFGDKLKCDAFGRFLLANAQDILDNKCVAWCYDGGHIGNRISVVLLGNAGVPTLAASETIADDADHVVATSPYTEQTLVTLATTNMTGALADGLYVGQTKKIRVDSQAAAFTYVLTPTTMKAGQPASFTFTAKGQEVCLTWTSTGWEVTGIKTAGIATPAAAATLNPLVALHAITIGSAGAEDRILPDGYVAGHMVNIVCAAIGSGSSTISGLFYNTLGAAAVDAVHNAAADQIALVWTGAKWMGIGNTSVTFA